MTVRMSSVSSASLDAVLGPRLRGGVAGVVARAFTAYTVERAISNIRQARARP